MWYKNRSEKAWKESHHVLVPQMLEDINLFPCTICGKSFNNKKIMTNHRRWHDVPEYREYQIRTRESMRNKIFTKEHRRNLSLAVMGENNPNWHDNDITVGTLHDHIKKLKSKSDRCESCGKVTSKLDLANISQEYKNDVNDFEWICRSCHMKKDGRAYKNLHNNHARGSKQ